MQMYQYKQLRITDLLLNTQNPRFTPVEHQPETIYAMIEDQGDKLIELAKHIATYGLNPMEIVLVQPTGKLWLVREGNRRVTALKLINEPNLIPDTKTKMKKEFTALNKSIESGILNNILCVETTDEDIINEWIRLKHTGENKGVGTVGWDAQQTSRFAAQISGKSDPKSTLFETLRKNKSVPQSIRAKFPAIKKTNYDRLVSDPQVRSLLGIETKNGEYLLTNGVNAYFIAVLSDLVDEFSVGRIYTKTDRKAYLEEIKNRVDGSTITPPKPEKTAIEQSPTPPPSIDGGQTGEKRQQAKVDNASGKSYPIFRKTLVPAQSKLVINNARLVRILHELKSLDCDQYPNAVSVLFRVFIELSCDCYITSKNLSGVSADSHLAKKIEFVANDIEEKQLMSKNELRASRQMASSPTQNQSVRTFHAYVHNKNFTPIASDLRTAWDDLWPFIETMWR